MLLNSSTRVPLDNVTRNEHGREKIEALINYHSKKGDTVIIPAPCVARKTPDDVYCDKLKLKLST